MARRLFCIITTVLALLAGPAAAQSAPVSRFEGWGAAIIAADWRDSHGAPIQAFDNARRDLVRGFLDAGFSRTDMVDYSLRPDAARPVTAEAAVQGVNDLFARATRGCFLYITSHGSPAGVVFGPDVTVNTTVMANLIRNWCGTRPTVIVISACFSGVFVDGLAASNRMILTAARRDRSSFGCGAEATYPYFDGCVLESLPGAIDFLALAAATRACVSRRETEEGLSPASEPQLYVGAEMQLRLPTLRFNRTGR